MNKIIIAILAAIALIGGLAMFGNGSEAEKGAEQMTFATVQQDVANGAKFYDVRTAQEYNEGRFENAVNWSLQDIEAGKLPDVPKDTKIYVHCQSGNRSGQATTILKNAGYTNVVDLGGLADVETIGGTLITQ